MKIKLFYKIQSELKYLLTTNNFKNSNMTRIYKRVDFRKKLIKDASILNKI